MTKHSVKNDTLPELLPEVEAELCSWNDEDVAFIKSGVHDGKEMWLIYAADGTKIAATDDRDFAFVMASRMISVRRAYID